MYVYIYMYIYLCIYICVCVCVCLCVCVFIHIYNMSVHLLYRKLMNFHIYVYMNVRTNILIIIYCQKYFLNMNGNS